MDRVGEQRLGGRPPMGGPVRRGLTGCGNTANVISVIPTPRQVLPILLPAAGPIRNSLRKGVAYADELQPESDTRDPWFWSHSARYSTLRHLAAANSRVGVEGWEVRSGVPNCGIHIRLGDLHLARVVRSLSGTTPPPGRNLARQRAWRGVGDPGPQQGQLNLDTDEGLPPLQLIVDWSDESGEPVIHVGLPSAPWDYRKAPRLHWRVQLPDEEVDLESLAFPGDVGGLGGGMVLELDRAELAP
jgi:hypothetical protein